MGHRVVLTMIGALLATLVVVGVLPPLEHDTSLAQLFGDQHVEQIAREFPSDETLLVVVEDRGATPIFNRAHAEWLHEFVARVERVPGVESVVSLANLPDVRFRLGLPRFGGSVLPRDVGEWSEAERAERLNDPFLRAGLIAQAGRASANWIMLERGLKAQPDYRERLAAIAEAVRAGSAPSALDVTVSGYPLVYSALADLALRDAVWLTLAALLALVAVALIVRAGGAAIVSFLAAWPLVALSFVGVHAGFGLRLHVFSNAVLPILMVTTGASFIHLALAWKRTGVFGGTLRACGLSVLTTAISFAVLAASELAPLRRLGIEVAIGSVGALVIFVSIFRFVLGAQYGRRPAVASFGAVRVGPGWLVWGLAVLLGVPWFVLSPGRLAETVSFIDRLPVAHPVAVDARRVRALLGESTAFEVILEYDDAEAMAAALKADGIEALVEFERTLQAALPSSDYILGPLSIVRFINQRMPRLFGGGSFTVSPRAAGIARGAFTGRLPMPGSMRAWMRQLVGERRLRFGLRVPDLPPHVILGAVDTIERGAASRVLSAHGAPRVRCVGYAVTVARTAVENRAQQVRSVAWSGGVLAVLLLAIVRSLIPWLIVLAVNALALVSVANVAWCFATPHGLFSTVLLASLLALLVDDNVHLLVAYRRGGGGGDGARAALAGVGPSIRVSSLALAVGFAVFLASSLPGYRQFAIGAIIAVALFLFWDLYVLPRCLGVARRVDRGEDRADSGE